MVIFRILHLLNRNQRTKKIRSFKFCILDSVLLQSVLHPLSICEEPASSTFPVDF